MVRETRHLWVGNLPDNIREERIRDHFKRYGRVQSVKLVPGGAGVCATVAFMDIKSASKAHMVEHTLDDRVLTTEYYEPGSQPPRYSLGGSEDQSPFDRSSHLSTPGSVSGGSPLSAGSRDVDYLRRPTTYLSAADPLRGRPRERAYRNGPTYSTTADRGSVGSQRRTWQGELNTCQRYPSESNDCVVSSGVVVGGLTVGVTGCSKRKQSGSESRSGSQSSRSRSPPVVRSPTHSPSASTRSSGSSSRSASPSEGKQSRQGVQSSVTPPTSVVSAGAAASAAATLSVYSDDRRPLAICVRDLPTRSSDTSLKDGLFHEYKKHGKVTWVKVVGSANDRYALVCFKKPEDVEKAIEVSQDKFFFGCKIDVAPYHGYDVEDNEARPYDTELDEFHPKATRTLFIGNLEKDITAQSIRQTFEQFGEIIEIDVKKQSGVALSYAFCQYADISSVVQAMRTLDGELLGDSRLKLGFGKSMASNCVWIAGVADQVSEKYLDMQFRKFGMLSQVVIDRTRGQALVSFDQVPSAAAAVKEMRGVTLRGRRIQIDFASRECQEAFFERMDTQREAWPATDARFRGNSYSRSTGGRTPRRHEVYGESPRYRSYEDLSPGSDYDDLQSEQTDLNHLHKRRDHIQKLLRQEKSKPTRSVMAADQGLVVTAHNHRRRLSSHRRSSGDGPAPLCKRRKTGSTSEDERRRHHHHSGDESRPGTPLIDELPDQRPKEPRKGPLKRPDEPLSLPLPEFAAHCLPIVRSTVAASVLSPPRSASPPLVPPSPLSNSSSEISPQSPTLEERIRSLDEKYEQWSGRTQPAVTKPRHHLLEVDVRELQPSDIVKSVLSRPSVFDEDSKRLENVNEKYEPREFSSFQRVSGVVPGDPRSSSFLLGSPSAAKGLQYPFPSHPPVLPSSGLGATAGSQSPPCPTVRTMSKSVEFSVQKAASWLGLNRSEDNPAGFSPRFMGTTIRPGKPCDPRLDKTQTSPALQQSPVTPTSLPLSTCVTTPPFPPPTVNRLCENERTIPPIPESPKSIYKPLRLHLPPEPPRVVPKRMEPSDSTLEPLSVLTAPAPSVERKMSVDSVESLKLECSVKAVATTVPMPNPVPQSVPLVQTISGRSAELALNNSDLLQLSERNTIVSAPCVETAPAANVPSVNNADPNTDTISNHSQSTNKLDISVIKPNVSQCKNSGPIVPDNGLTSLTINHVIPPKAVSENVPFNIRDKESGSSSSDRHKAYIKEKEKSRDEKEKCISANRDSERDRHRDKAISDKERDKEKDRHKSMSREKTKEREISEIVDKERKKERDVEIDRKKDREAMEVTEREKKEGDIDSKKEHLDTLDRRKPVEKRPDHHERKSSDQSDRVKKRDGDRERRRDDKERRKEHSDKHKERKSVEDKKREEDRHRDKNAISQPAAIGAKRRISSADSLDSEEAKRAKVDPKRRDSRDSRSSGSSKRSDSKPPLPKLEVEPEKSKPEVKHCESKKREENEKRKYSTDSTEKSRSKDYMKIKTKVKCDKEEIRSVKEYNGKSGKENHDKDKDHSTDSEEERRHNNNRKEMKLKRNPFGSSDSLDEKKSLKREKMCGERKREDVFDKEKLLEPRRENGITESCTDSDSEPKKHSIFDVVVDDSPYISMYDKVKARSTKNLQKQEEEKRQVKLKEKFSALKQSRAKREEKKRSTSWDEDSDSDGEIRKSRPRRFSRLSSDDDSHKDAREHRESLRCSSSEDAMRDRPPRLRASEIYTDDDSDSMEKKLFKSKLHDDDLERKNHGGNGGRLLNHHQLTNSLQNTPRTDNNKINKVRLSLDSSTERLTNDNRPKKKVCDETQSESEHVYPSKSEKCERKKTKKKEKRQKWSDDEKSVGAEERERRRLEKKERRKSLQMESDGHDENKPKRRLPSLTAPDPRTDKLEQIFGSEDSDHMQHKADASKSIPSKWQVDEIYNSDDSDLVGGMPHLVQVRKLKDKKKKEKKNREPCKEVIQVAQSMEYTTHDFDEIKNDPILKIRGNKEKKKKRKKSKDERNHRHHHHHESRDSRDREKKEFEFNQHTNSISEKMSPTFDDLPRRSKSPDNAENLLHDESKSPQTYNEPERSTSLCSSPPMPILTKTRKEILPLFCDTDEKQHQSAVQSISQPDTPKSCKSASSGTEERETSKERTVISQEETDVAVAALLGETFTFGSCYSGSPPAEPEPAPSHDEEEMRQAVQSLNSDVKPPTPQSDNDLQIDTDAEENDEFGSSRYDFIPRTPDVELGPPKTPDISPGCLTPNKPFVRKDTMRNSRDDMEVPIVDTPPSSYPHDTDRKPPVLTPPPPKVLFPEESSTSNIESPIKRFPEKVFMDGRDRLLLVPPPLVPVSKQVSPSPPRAPGNVTIVRPLISLSSHSAQPTTTLVLTPIRTTTAGPVHSTPLPRKTYTLSPPGGLITTRVTIPPPVLSPVTPSNTAAPKLPSPGNTRLTSQPSATTPRVPGQQPQLLIATVPTSQPTVRPVISPPDRIKPTNMPVLSPTDSALSPNPRPTIQNTPVIAHAPPERCSVPPLRSTSMHTTTTTTSSVSSVVHSVQSLIQPKPVVSATPVLPATTHSIKTNVLPPLETPTVLTSVGNVENKNLGVSVICSKPALEKPTTLLAATALPIEKREKISKEEDNSVVDCKEVIQEKSEIVTPKAEIKHEKLDLVVPEIKTEVDDDEVKTTPTSEKLSTPDFTPVLPMAIKTDPADCPVSESVIKRVESVEKLEPPVTQPQSIEPGSDKEGSSDDDKPINTIARKNRKKAARGGSASARRGQRAPVKNEPIVPPTIETSPVNAVNPAKRGGRGRGARGGSDAGRKLAADVYEFHDESDEENAEDQERPRLVITIKSPVNKEVTPPVSKASALSPKDSVAVCKSMPVPVVKTKEPTPEPQKSPGNNTRKSRRLIEKERNTIDEVIEDVIRNANNQRTSPRRSMRQTLPVNNSKPVLTPSKKPRNKRVVNEDDNKDDVPKTTDLDETCVEENKEVVVHRPVEAETSETSDEEPRTLIDPVTGMLMVMRAKEGGKYVPVPVESGAPLTPPPSAASITPMTIPSTASTPISVASGPAVTTVSAISTPLITAVTTSTNSLISSSVSTIVSSVTTQATSVLKVATSSTVAPAPIPMVLPKQPAPQEPTIVNEGLASHWLGQANVAKTSPKPPLEKPTAPYLGCRPPTPPTTPLAVQMAATIPPHIVVGKIPDVPMRSMPDPTIRHIPDTPLRSLPPEPPVKPIPETTIRSLPESAMRPLPEPHIRSIPETAMRPLPETTARPIPETAMRPVPKPHEPPLLAHKHLIPDPKVVVYPEEYLAPKPGIHPPSKNMAKPLYARGKLGAPEKPLYPGVRCVQPSVKSPLYGPVRLSKPASSPPLTGAVASPPPRAPHYASPQPVVAGASSSRSLGDNKGPRGSPRPLAIVSPYEGPLGELGHLSPFMHHHQFVYQPYLQGILPPYRLPGNLDERGAGDMGHSPPGDLRRPGDYMGPHMGRYYDEPPPAHLHPRQSPLAVAPQSQPALKAEAPSQPQPRIQVATPPHASQVPVAQDSLATLLMDYPMMWQGLLALKNDQSAVQMHFVLGNEDVARECLRCNPDGSTSPLRIAQRMRLEHNQLEGVARKMQIENEHCMLLALPCGRDQMDVLKQSVSLNNAFISYLQQKQAAGIVNVMSPRNPTLPAYVVHIFPACDFANAYLARVAPDLVHCMQDIPHLIIVIATV